MGYEGRVHRSGHHVWSRCEDKIMIDSCGFPASHCVVGSVRKEMAASVIEVIRNLPPFLASQKEESKWLLPGVQSLPGGFASVNRFVRHCVKAALDEAHGSFEGQAATEHQISTFVVSGLCFCVLL